MNREHQTDAWLTPRCTRRRRGIESLFVRHSPFRGSVRNMKVFISYSSKNRLRALRLAQKLLEHDVQVWYDRWNILIGQSIVDSIYDGIRACDYLAVILTNTHANHRGFEKN